MSSKSYAAVATVAAAVAVMTPDPHKDRKDRWETLAGKYYEEYLEKPNMWTMSCRHGGKCSRLEANLSYLKGDGRSPPPLCVFNHPELDALFLHPDGSFREDPPVDYCPVISDPVETKDELANTKDELTETKDELAKIKDELAKIKSELAETEARNQNYTAVWHQLVGAMQVLKTMLEHSGSECSGVCDEVLVIMGAVPYAPSTV